MHDPEPLSPPFAILPADPATIAARCLRRDRRVLLFGPPGVGKSTLAARLADHLLATGRECSCISADPGSPAFGVPGTLTLGRRSAGGWQATATQPLCTLDAGRFRLPLLAGVQRLLEGLAAGMLLIDSPGVVRGVAGSELVQALVDLSAVDLVLVVSRSAHEPPLAAELAALPVECCIVEAAAGARRPGKPARARARSRQWDAYLSYAVELQLDLDHLPVIGTPPPLDEPEAWPGRQVALLRQGSCLGLGEALALSGRCLTLRAPPLAAAPDALLLRDAARSAQGLLESAAPFAAASLAFLPPAGLVPESAATQGPRPVGRVGGVDLALVNGLFGDPLLHLRLRHQARSLLFDLGDGSRLSARIAHQVSDVFISHAHMDHLGGFLWLLRSRVGDFPPCRLYGPPGLARHVSGLVYGFLWDRVGELGPAFEVAELHGATLRRWRVQAGHPGRVELAAQPAHDGVLLREPGFRVRAVVLDHHTPVLAFAFEPARELKVRADRLKALGVAPGPWLNALKQRVSAGDSGSLLTLPDGREAAVAELTRELLVITPGRRLVYATDLADTPSNRERLVALAQHAHTLFLEAVFTEAHGGHARRHGHLTARACGEIASAAGVSRLVPFHFSRRYVDDPQALFEELSAACGSVVLPEPQRLRGAAPAAAAADADFLID
jgi:ribonuclease BN (tRNA processing enzyme)